MLICASLGFLELCKSKGGVKDKEIVELDQRWKNLSVCLTVGWVRWLKIHFIPWHPNLVLY